MRATRYDAGERYEIFARLRAANPAAEFDELMDRVFEIEDDAAQEAHERMIDSQDSERDEW